MSRFNATLRDSDADRIEVTIEDTSADGELRVVELRGRAVTSLRSGYDHGRRMRAFRRHPVCHECQKRIGAAKDAGVFALDGVDRLAHKRPCFLLAIAKLNPTFSKVSAFVRDAHATAGEN